MIRGPILPQARARLWALVRSRFDAIESGLELIVESLDCSDGQFGPIDGLCRDASGAPVLMALALEEDAMLMPRILAADEFLDRVGEGLADAVLEGRFRSGVAPRLVVLGSTAAAGPLVALARLRLSRLERCRLEPFRLGGSERFAVRWLDGAAARPQGGEAPVADTPAARAQRADAETPMGADESLWQAVAGLCRRLDPAVEIDGGRFRRRIRWRGRTLGQVTSLDGALRASTIDGAEFAIEGKADVRAFGDRLVRRFAELAGLVDRATAASPRQHTGPAAAEERVIDRARSAEVPARPVLREQAPTAVRPAGTLRSALAEAMLSPEEFAALTQPAETARPNDSPD